MRRKAQIIHGKVEKKINTEKRKEESETHLYFHPVYWPIYQINREFWDLDTWICLIDNQPPPNRPLPLPNYHPSFYPSGPFPFHPLPYRNLLPPSRCTLLINFLISKPIFWPRLPSYRCMYSPAFPGTTNRARNPKYMLWIVGFGPENYR